MKDVWALPFDKLFLEFFSSEGQIEKEYKQISLNYFRVLTDNKSMLWPIYRYIISIWIDIKKKERYRK